MPRPSKFMLGARFERLVTLKKLPNNRALCRCDCGTEKSINLNHLTRGLIRSCGCLHKEITSALMTKMSTKHGMYGTPIYGVWNSMMDRCCNAKNHAFKDYGARGITVCKRWFKFENFLADMGEPNGLTLERKNNARGYMPSNCKWATMKEQMNNRRSCVKLTYEGKTKTISQWADHLGVPRMLLYGRNKAGWSVERMFTAPKRGAS